MDPIIIVGTGMAGYGVARELRKLDKQLPLILVSADDGRAYSKPMLSNALTKGKTAAELATADADAMSKQLDAEIRVNSRVLGINTHSKNLDLGDETLAYSKLVLALGADPFRPPMEGDAGRVISVNDLIDYERFRQALDGKHRIAILGGGLIGCEFANDLINNGYKADVIDRSALPLSTLLPSIVSERLLLALEQLGVQWHGSTTATNIQANGHEFTLLLDNGEELCVDVVLSAIGLRARTELANDAGISVKRGIVVDRFLQTSADDVYALGDCAEVEGNFLPFVMPLMRCTKVLAQTLVGEKTAVSYPAMPVVLKTPAYPISVLPPPAGVPGEWQVEEEKNAMRARFVGDDGRLRGFVLCQNATKEATKLATTIPALME